jgi:hypothetical protein
MCGRLEFSQLKNDMVVKRILFLQVLVEDKNEPVIAGPIAANTHGLVQVAVILCAYVADNTSNQPQPKTK